MKCKKTNSHYLCLLSGTGVHIIKVTLERSCFHYDYVACMCRYSPANMGLLDPQTSDGRVIFFLPWQSATMAGTTTCYCC